MSELTTEEIETCIKAMFAEEGPAALDEAYAIYRRGGITSTRWARAMWIGLKESRHELAERIELRAQQLDRGHAQDQQPL